ncbi:DUF4097 family beta strand repeat-containing protein [Spongiimicrobium salis]|uniref:hypothetical protein n=1 Tax=Spongiimicrobium salis TaxID=1667022 RepID=UPI00374CEAEC
MSTTVFKYTILLFLLPITLIAGNGTLKGKYKKEKTIKKEFNVAADALLKVKNRYGNLNITSWNENRVVIEVHIKTSGNKEEKVQERLNEITVNFENSNTLVDARTMFKKSSNRGWGWDRGKRNVSVQVNYTIKLPVKNSVHLSNDYGNIYLDRIDGHAKINCDYGRLDIGELRGRNNQLNFDYTSKSTIDFIESGKITADYSGFTIAKAGDLEINADYTNSTVEEMENLDYTADYGKIVIGEANNVKGNGDYINVKLGIIHGNVQASADYGSIRIDRMASDAGNIDIRTDYTGIKIGYASDYYFDFEIETEYAGVSGKDDFEVNISKVKSSEKYYKGYYGKANSGNRIFINSEYGGISFFKN